MNINGGIGSPKPRAGSTTRISPSRRATCSPSPEPFDLQFFGDDDTFVFINGVLMIDLGGVHQRLPGKVHVNADGAATIQEGGNIYMACTAARPTAR